MDVIQIPIPGGKAGTLTVLRQMAEIVRDSARDAEVRAFAIDRARTVYAASYVDFVRGVRGLFFHFFRYIDEPDEMIATPRVMLATLRDAGVIHGDCDDAAVLAGALFYSLGFGVRFRAVLAQAD